MILLLPLPRTAGCTEVQFRLGGLKGVSFDKDLSNFSPISFILIFVSPSLGL